jgi:hypothetical protein
MDRLCGSRIGRLPGSPFGPRPVRDGKYGFSIEIRRPAYKDHPGLEMVQLAVQATGR